MGFDPRETETHEAAHAVIALVLEASGVVSISIGEELGPGKARVEFVEDMRDADPARPLWNLARAVTIGAGERSSLAVLGRTSRAHWSSTHDDDAKVYFLTEPWHRRSQDRWSQVGSDVGSLATVVCKRHAAAIRAVADVLLNEGQLAGDRFVEIARAHLTDEDCEQSRADLRALAERLGAPVAPTEKEY
jgi:hypothetical protein